MWNMGGGAVKHCVALIELLSNEVACMRIAFHGLVEFVINLLLNSVHQLVCILPCNRMV